MARTVQIQGSDEVMAMFGQPGVYYRGKWENAKITKTSTDKDVPLEVRKALVGLTIPTIFTKESIENQTKTNFPIPKESRLAYCLDVAEALESAGKQKEANQLRNTFNNSLDMYVIEKEVYEIINN